jgi:N-acetylglutamate synthase-like GNAT family acetyltransferase
MHMAMPKQQEGEERRGTSAMSDVAPARAKRHSITHHCPRATEPNLEPVPQRDRVRPSTRAILMVSMITISQATDFDTVRTLLRGYTELVGLDVPFDEFEKELAELGDYYDAVFLAQVGENVAGCVALLRVDDQLCHLRRLYVKPPFRRQGAGHALVQCAIEAARNLGYDRMRASAASGMKDAARLFELFGFRDTEPFGERPASRCMAFSLFGDGMPESFEGEELGELNFGEEES